MSESRVQLWYQSHRVGSSLHETIKVHVEKTASKLNYGVVVFEQTGDHQGAGCGRAASLQPVHLPLLCGGGALGEPHWLRLSQRSRQS